MSHEHEMENLTTSEHVIRNGLILMQVKEVY